MTKIILFLEYVNQYTKREKCLNKFLHVTGKLGFFREKPNEQIQMDIVQRIIYLNMLQKLMTANVQQNQLGIIQITPSSGCTSDNIQIIMTTYEIRK